MSIEYSTMEKCLECGAEYDPDISKADEPEIFCSSTCEHEYWDEDFY